MNEEHYLELVYKFFMDFWMYGFVVWASFWALSQLLAPLIREILKGLRFRF